MKTDCISRAADGSPAAGSLSESSDDSIISFAEGFPGSRRSRACVVAAMIFALCVPLAWAEAPALEGGDGDLGQELQVQGMTFVASEGSANEILLRAVRARFYPEQQIADLEEVEVEVAPGEGRTGFEMRCDGGRLNLATQDFVAEGHVVGTIEGQRQFEALWVAYDEEKGLLYTDEPVQITDADGRYQGGGFRYFVNEQRFRLQGGARIVQEP